MQGGILQESFCQTQCRHRLQRRSFIHPITHQPELLPLKLHPDSCSAFFCATMEQKLNSLLSLYGHLSADLTDTVLPLAFPKQQRFFLVSLTTFSISSRSHCDVSLTISDSWRRDLRSLQFQYMVTFCHVNQTLPT